LKVNYLHGGALVRFARLTYRHTKAAERAFKEVYGKKSGASAFSGGSIPIIATFEETLSIKSVLMGFGLASDAIHSPNEKLPAGAVLSTASEPFPLFYKYLPEEMGK